MYFLGGETGYSGTETVDFFCYEMDDRLKMQPMVTRMMIGSMLKKGLLRLSGKEMRLLSRRRRLGFQKRVKTNKAETRYVI